MDWKHLLAYITGTVDQELLWRNEYLVTENRMLRHQINGRVRLSDAERKTLAEIGQQLGKQALAEGATIVIPDTLLAWHRKLVGQKFDGSQQRRAPGRPQIDPEMEALVLRLARENHSWGYDRIVGALANLGYTISDQTVGNILKRHGLAPAPERKTTTTWKEFIHMHLDLLVATDFFTAEVWTLSGLVTYYVLFFIHLGSRKVHIAGMTLHPGRAVDGPGRTQCGLLARQPPSTCVTSYASSRVSSVRRAPNISAVWTRALLKTKGISRWPTQFEIEIEVRSPVLMARHRRCSRRKLAPCRALPATGRRPMAAVRPLALFLRSPWMPIQKCEFPWGRLKPPPCALHG